MLMKRKEKAFEREVGKSERWHGRPAPMCNVLSQTFAEKISLPDDGRKNGRPEGEGFIRETPTAASKE